GGSAIETLSRSRGRGFQNRIFPGFDGGTSPLATPVGSRCPPDSGGRCASLPNFSRTANRFRNPCNICMISPMFKTNLLRLLTVSWCFGWTANALAQSPEQADPLRLPGYSTPCGQR